MAACVAETLLTESSYLVVAQMDAIFIDSDRMHIREETSGQFAIHQPTSLVISFSDL